MELNIKEQTEKLQAELAILLNQKQELINAILKKAGALELLQGLDGDKPEPIT